jgi:hypothetical protein
VTVEPEETRQARLPRALLPARLHRRTLCSPPRRPGAPEADPHGRARAARRRAAAGRGRGTRLHERNARAVIRCAPVASAGGARRRVTVSPSRPSIHGPS